MLTGTASIPQSSLQSVSASLAGQEPFVQNEVSSHSQDDQMHAAFEMLCATQNLCLLVRFRPKSSFSEKYICIYFSVG